MRHVREHEQWFRDHGATTYAQPDIVGLWMRWPAPARRRYLELLRRADKQVAVEPTFTKAAFQRRNAWMVDNCTPLIAVWDGSSGGTANCVRYAQNVLRPTLYLNPQALSRRLY